MTRSSMSPSSSSLLTKNSSGKSVLTASTPNAVGNINPSDPIAHAGYPGQILGPGTNANGKPIGAISGPNTVQLHQLLTGCKVYVERPGEDSRKAEILSIRQTRVPRASRPKPGEEPPKPAFEYYVHYVEFNKRLDEWVVSARLHLDRQIEWPIPKDQQTGVGHGHGPTPVNQKAPSKRADQGLRKTAIKQNALSTVNQKLSVPTTKANQKKRKLGHSASTPSSLAADDDNDASMTVDSPGTRSTSVALDRDSSADPGTPDETQDADGEPEDDNEPSGAVITVDVGDEDAEGDDDIDLSETVAPDSLEKHSHFSKEQEIESLRTHGSMTQSVHEISRVKNLDKIQIGPHEVEAWYFSAYPVEYAHIPVLYICEFCLCFYGSPKMLERHRKKCTLLHPPGNEIYRQEDLSFFEIDGKKQKTWCRNLCLLSKCFLDHKTLYYDVDPFMFYVMCKRDDLGVHIIGYFSKEKESVDGYNLACILTLPQHQRHGYGKLLIEFSYELSKKEGKAGSPEKPLSDLGLLSYRAYWQELIVELILQQKSSGKDALSIDEISSKTAILNTDVMHTLQALQMVKTHNNQYVICLSDALIESHERTKKKKRRRIDPNCLIWKPPHFTKEQLRFGF